MTNKTIPNFINFVPNNPTLQNFSQLSASSSYPLLPSHAAAPQCGQKRPSPPHPHDRGRRVRPKVIPEKGSIQCEGNNQKKGVRCRNAALMEYIGPRPVYCAEHIEQDPRSLYAKCKSNYQRIVDDKKGCKEIVLKEFSFCYKHYGDIINSLPVDTIILHHQKVKDILVQLEKEATEAKKRQQDLFQRKNKLIPKFQRMHEILSHQMALLNKHQPLVVLAPSSSSSPPSSSSSSLAAVTTQSTASVVMQDGQIAPVVTLENQKNEPVNVEDDDDDDGTNLSSPTTTLTPITCCEDSCEVFPSPSRSSETAQIAMNSATVDSDGNHPHFPDFDFSNTSTSSPEEAGDLYVCNTHEDDFYYLSLAGGTEDQWR